MLEDVEELDVAAAAVVAADVVDDVADVVVDDVPN